MSLERGVRGVYSEAEIEPWGHHTQFPKVPPRSSLACQLWETSHSFLINIRSYPSVSVALAVQASLTKLPGLAILKAQLILATHQRSFIFCVPTQVTNTPDCKIDFWSVRCWRCMPAHCLRTPRCPKVQDLHCCLLLMIPTWGFCRTPVLICFWGVQNSAQRENQLLD